MDFLKKNPRFAENDPLGSALDKGHVNLEKLFKITDVEVTGDCKITTFKTVDLKNGLVFEQNFIEKESIKETFFSEKTSINIAISQLTDLKVGDTCFEVEVPRMTMPVTVTAGDVPLGPNTITTSLAPKALPGTVIAAPAATVAAVVQVPLPL